MAERRSLGAEFRNRGRLKSNKWQMGLRFRAGHAHDIYDKVLLSPYSLMGGPDWLAWIES